MPTPREPADGAVSPARASRTRDAEQVEPLTRAAWRRWLESNHDTSSGVWAVYRRKSAAGPRNPGYEELVCEALCFGWVDSRPGSVDERRTRLYFSPRRRGSGWAASNKARIERLIAEGRMHESGLAVLEQARSDGSWSRIDGSESGQVPDDLRKALRRHRGATSQWEGFPPGVRRQIVQWIEQARTPETRARRVEETATLAAQGIRANQWKPKPAAT